jgi:hypothetical protein
MPYITQDDEATEEEIIREGLKHIPVQVVNRISPETADRREAKRKKDFLVYQQQQKQQILRLEQQEKIDRALQKADDEAYLKLMNYPHIPLPHQQFFHEGICDICKEEVMYLNENSPHLTARDYPFAMARDKDHKNDYGNYDTKHICSEVKREVIAQLWDTIADLNARLSRHDALEKRYVRM